MRKIYAYLFLTAAFLSCDNKEESPSKNNKQLYIINGDIEYYADITDGSKPKKPIFIYDIPEKKIDNKKTTRKLSDGTVVLDFSYGISGNTNSGCTVDVYSSSTGTYNTNRGVYGYYPYSLHPDKNQYLIRGYGKPHHNYYYNSLILQTSNNSFTYNHRPSCSAISIEYEFKPNITYEISLLTHFVDNRKLTESKHSEGFPSVNVYLSDSPILSSIDKACEKNIFRTAILTNYARSYTLEDNIIKDRTLQFKFSPTEEKKALIISLFPNVSDTRGTAVPISNYTMLLPTVTIKELPFDPSINITEGRR